MTERSIDNQAEENKSTSVRISRKAKDALGEMARASGVPSRLYLEMLLNYAYSTHRRPGSWEASMPFDIQTYVRADTVADRWF